MATEALTGDQDYLEQNKTIYQQRRDLCLEVLGGIGLEAPRPKGALYIWFRTPPGFTSMEYHTLLLEKAHISVTPGHIYGANGEGWMRISLVASLERLGEALNRLKKATRME